MTKLIAIAALGKNNQIGLKGELPWSIPEEYRHYQDTVKDEYVIVGRRNFELQSEDIRLSKPLILTTQKDYTIEGKGDIFTSVQALEEFLLERKVSKAFVIGGEQIYKLLYPKLDEMMLSFVDYDGTADTYFPHFEGDDWSIFTQRQHQRYLFIHYKRVDK